VRSPNATRSTTPTIRSRYTFQLFALDTKLSLGTEATRNQIMDAMNGHIIGKAVYVGRYYRR
jgi:phosphatidylethanolamine-binding protein (PEBP) family uncharacterized protein